MGRDYKGRGDGYCGEEEATKAQAPGDM